MAQAVAETLAARDTLLCEAGTGTGKTFAYLAPVLRSGLRTIVSTGTKTLQDQLYYRDLPIVRAALRAGGTAALLKGRANYLCLYRLECHAPRRQGHGHGRADAELAALCAFAARTASGDRADLSTLAEDAEIWPDVTSTAENCLGQECPAFSDCFVVKARRRAAEADLVVVNHHLFLADLSLREEGFGEILPLAEAVILDEAHQLAEVAQQFFGVAFSSRLVLDLLRDANLAFRTEAGDVPGFVEALAEISGATKRFALLLARHGERADWDQALDVEGIRVGGMVLLEELVDLVGILTPLAERGRGLGQALKRAAAVVARLHGFLHTEMEVPMVRWFEADTRGFRLQATPLELGTEYQARVGKLGAAFVYTSATLAVSGNFQHFRRRLSLTVAREGLWESPFDYARQALLYLPPLAMAPSSPGYTAACVAAALPVLRASGGRAFFLFTSNRALKEAAERLRAVLEYPMLVQGEGPKARLLEEFMDYGNAVLLGAATFWEGVDVRGEALSLVIIDKLPFASPGDPVVKARIDAIALEGGNAFRDFQLPEAVLSLKQGAGRLVRDVRDSGVLMICDPRLTTRPYGKVFLKSLPPMPVTSSLADVERFFA
jgi:ATP-dependent DNA helicase DinG